MPDPDLSIERATQLAIAEVIGAISSKTGRSLTHDETAAVTAIIDTEHFWARAEEMRMFVQLKDPNDVQNMVNSIGERYRNGGKAAFERPAAPDPAPRHCNMCKGSGECYCIRKGPGNAANCPRCSGNAQCRYCRGSGTIRSNA